MQYLLKAELTGTALWRLTAVDGLADICFTAELLALAFGYPPGPRSFETAVGVVPAGSSGKADSAQQLVPFDSLGLGAGQTFFFVACAGSEILRHRVTVMKREERLYCLVPSCLIGAGALPQMPLTHERINAFYEDEENPGLNLKEVTARMRAFGIRRSDMHKAMIEAGADSLQFVRR